MRGFIAGLTLGAIIFAGVPAFAGSELLGKEVEKEVSVTLNGEKVSSGVIIEGSTYAPVRSISEAIGLGVSYEGGVVSLSEENTETNLLPDLSIPEIAQPPVDTSDPYRRFDTVEKINDRITRLESSIVQKQNLLDAYQNRINQIETAFADNSYNEKDRVPLEEELESRQRGVEECQELISKYNTEIEDLRAKLAKLEAAATTE